MLPQKFQKNHLMAMVALSAILLQPGIVLGESDSADISTESLFRELDALSVTLQENPQDSTARENLREISQRLIALGETIRPNILPAIMSSANEPYRRELTYILGEIPGSESDRMLVQLLCSEASPAVASMALMQLLHRADSNGPLSFALREDEMEILLTALKEAKPGYETQLIRLLGLCAQNDVDGRFNPILARFREMVHFEGPFPNVKDTFVSPRVYALNGYLLAFKGMGGTAWEPLRQERVRAIEKNDEEFAKWLCIAAGFAGDPQAGPCNETIVLTETDSSTRYVAIRAYAWSAGTAAIPILETLVDDKTESEYSTDAWPFYIIGSIARGHLLELKGE